MHLADLDDFTIEVPSWAYGNSGTRFKVFTTAGTPRDPYEKISDAAEVHRYTGLAPRVSLHIPWNMVGPMDIPDGGTSLLHCLALGERAQVVLDTGHHAPGTNIEFIVTQLLRQGRLRAFDFNSRFYADDDLIVGSADPFQLFRIMVEIVSAGAHRPSSGVNFMLDQCHNIEPKIPGQIRSVLNVEQALAKALQIDFAALTTAQEAGDVLGANALLMDGFETEVRGALTDRREKRGLPRDPIAAYAASGYAEEIADARVGGVQASWGA